MRAISVTAAITLGVLSVAALLPAAWSTSPQHGMNSDHHWTASSDGGLRGQVNLEAMPSQLGRGTQNFHVEYHTDYPPGTWVWWCGWHYDSDGGYGNDWDDVLVIPDLDLTGALYPMLTFAYRTDSEAGHDFTYVQAKQGGVYTNLNTGYDGVQPWTHLGDYGGFYLGFCDSPLEVRFRFVSDGAGSDEDGLYSSVGGAFMCDNVRVYDYFSGVEYFYDDVEDMIGLCYSTEGPAKQQAFCGWELGSTVLGLDGSGVPAILASNVGNPHPVHSGERSLRLEENSTADTSRAYVAWVTGLTAGDLVEASVWRYDDSPGAPPSCRLWAHWNDDPGDVTGDAGNASGNPDHGPGAEWDLVTWSWPNVEGHTGLVIEIQTYDLPGDVVWIDELQVTAPEGATIHLPSDWAGVEEEAVTSWSKVKALFR